MLQRMALVALCLGCGSSAVHTRTAEHPAANDRPQATHAQARVVREAPRNAEPRVAEKYLRDAIASVEVQSVKMAHRTLDAAARRDVALVTCLNRKRDAIESLLEILETQVIEDDAKKRAETMTRVRTAWERASALFFDASHCV